MARYAHASAVPAWVLVEVLSEGVSTMLQGWHECREIDRIVRELEAGWRLRLADVQQIRRFLDACGDRLDPALHLQAHRALRALLEGGVR